MTKENYFVVTKQGAIILFLFAVSLNAAGVESTPSTEENQDTSVDCNENGDCPTSAMNCHKICGCDRSAFVAVYYNETSKSCIVSFKHLMISQINIYEDKNESDGTSADSMEERIRKEAERIFNTILVSVLLFLTCCAICFISACLYCCRISYADYRLNSDVKALAKKLKRDKITFRKPAKNERKPTTAVSQSCNVVCEDAGVFVV